MAVPTSDPLERHLLQMSGGSNTRMVTLMVLPNEALSTLETPVTRASIRAHAIETAGSCAIFRHINPPSVRKSILPEPKSASMGRDGGRAGGGRPIGNRGLL
jgi:hypothetical protein